MEKSDKILICSLLMIIIICSIILIFKIKSSREYDEQLYAEIYSEYNELFGNIDNNEVKKKMTI